MTFDPAGDETAEDRRIGDEAGDGAISAPELIGPTIKAHPVRRTTAFAIDMTIVGTVNGVLDQFISIPVPPLVIGLLHSAILVCYFLIFHQSATPVRSPGKRLMKLHILDERGGLPGAGAIAARYGLLAAIFLMDWTGTLMWLSPAEIPGLVPLVLRTVGIGVVLCSALLAVFDGDGRTVHDLLFRTRVRRSLSLEEATKREETMGERRPPRRLRLAPIVSLSALIGFAAALALFGHSIGSFGPEIGSRLLAVAPDYADPTRMLEQKIGEEYGIRADAGMTQGTRWSSGEGKTRFLTISVSMSFLTADEATRQAVTGLIADNLTVQPNFYDEVTVEIVSGFPIKTTWRAQLTQNAN